MSNSMRVLSLSMLVALSACGRNGDSDDDAPSPPPPAEAYGIGGMVSGLIGGTVTLQLNGGGDLALSANGGFTFDGAGSAGFAYAVTVATQPQGQTCAVANGAGTVASANVTNVTVSCQTNVPGGGIGSSTQRLLRLRYDLDNNGVIDAVRTFDYDADGRVIDEQYVYTDDGSADTDFDTFSIDAPPHDQHVTYAYTATGLLERWTIADEPGEREENVYQYGSDALVDRYAVDLFDAQGALAGNIAFTLDQSGTQLIGWESIASNGATPIQRDELRYDSAGRVGSDLLTTTLTGAQRLTTYTYTASGRIDTIRQSDPAPNSPTLIEANYVYDTLDRLTRVSFTGPTAGERYTWTYEVNSNGLRTQWRIDMGSNQTVEAVIHSEWEAAPCRHVFLWAPRAHPNFVADESVPYAPGSGYAVQPVCGP